MKIVWQEMKKIISVKKMLYLACFAVLYYFMLLNPYIKDRTAESYHEEADIVGSFIGEFGTELDREEWSLLQSRRPEYEYREVDGYIASSEEFESLGIRNFAEFMDAIGEQRVSLEESNRLWFLLMDGLPQTDLSEEMERLIVYDIWDHYIETYETEISGDGSSYYSGLGERQKARVAERNEKEVYGLLPMNIVHNNFEVLRFLAAFLVIAMLFLILPYMVSENRSRMPALQYSFRKGRGYYRCRLWAVLLSCLFISALVAAVYWAVAMCNRVVEFKDCYLSAYSSAFISWFPWTLGLYSVFSLGIAVLFSTGLSLAVFVATGYLENYVTAIAWLLPASGAGVFFEGFLLYQFDEITRLKGLVPLAGACAMAAGLFAVWVQGRLERRRDIIM